MKRPYAQMSRQTLAELADLGDEAAEFELDLRDEYDRDEREADDGEA